MMNAPPLMEQLWYNLRAEKWKEHDGDIIKRIMTASQGFKAGHRM